jgi:hypothetical protein
MAMPPSLMTPNFHTAHVSALRRMVIALRCHFLVGSHSYYWRSNTTAQSWAIRIIGGAVIADFNSFAWPVLRLRLSIAKPVRLDGGRFV